MLFDLQGKRRRVVQVVYAVLAALFLISFVGFGIGSNATGGIFDALGIGGGDSGSSNPQYQSQIDAQEAKLATNAKDERALQDLARLHFLAGQSALETDQSGQPTVTDEAKTQFDQSVKAWERYLKQQKKKPDANLAGLVVQSYVYLNDAEGAAATQQIVADARPSQGAYANLALYLYAGGEFGAGDAAAKKAVAEADSSQRKSLKRQLDQIAKQAHKQQKAIEKAAKNAPQGQNPLQNPLSGGSGIGAPAAPTTP